MVDIVDQQGQSKHVGEQNEFLLEGIHEILEIVYSRTE